MGDFNFIKQTICAKNGWNPYDEEILKIPSFYWMLAYKFNMYHQYKDWEFLYKPQAELISSITSPQNFEAYSKIKKKNQQVKNSQESFNIKTEDGGIARTSAKFDPSRGLVDSKGNVIMSVTEYMKRTDLKGIMVSE